MLKFSISAKEKVLNGTNLVQFELGGTNAAGILNFDVNITAGV